MISHEPGYPFWAAFTLFAVFAISLIAAIAFNLHQLDRARIESQTKTERTNLANRMHFSEVKKRLVTGTLLVWRSDSSVTRVQTISSDHSKLKHKKPNGAFRTVAVETVAEDALFAFPPRSSLHGNPGDISRYRRAALVFADPGYNNYFKAPIH